MSGVSGRRLGFVSLERAEPAVAPAHFALMMSPYGREVTVSRANVIEPQ